MARTTSPPRTWRPIRDHDEAGRSPRSSRNRISSGLGLLSKASFRKREHGGIASSLWLMSSTDIRNATVACTASPRRSDSAGWASRLVRSRASWASRHGTPGGSAPRACSSHFAASWCAGTRRRNEPKPKQPDVTERRTTGGGAAGHPAALYRRERGLRLTMAGETRCPEAVSDQPIGRRRNWLPGIEAIARCLFIVNKATLSVSPDVDGKRDLAPLVSSKRTHVFKRDSPEM